jgi:hypothetical protein
VDGGVDRSSLGYPRCLCHRCLCCSRLAFFPGERGARHTDSGFTPYWSPDRGRGGGWRAHRRVLPYRGLKWVQARSGSPWASAVRNPPSRVESLSRGRGEWKCSCGCRVAAFRGVGCRGNDLSYSTGLPSAVSLTADGSGQTSSIRRLRGLPGAYLFTLAQPQIMIIV